MVCNLKLATLLYHEVTDDPRLSGFQRPAASSYKLPRAVFAAHLDQLAKLPHSPELVTQLDFTSSGKHVLLTFDDGGKSWLHIVEELNRRSWKAHFFVTTSLIGSRTFLNKSEIRYVQSCGHVIGSHSHEHPDIFKDQPLSKMVAEWRVSREIIEDITGEQCHLASLPGGDLSGEVLRSANLAGVRYLFTSEPWLQPRRADAAWVLGRVCPKNNTPEDRIFQLADGRGWARELAIRRAKVCMRSFLAPLYRMYVRRNTREFERDPYIEQVESGTECSRR